MADYIYIPIPDKKDRSDDTRPVYISKITGRPNSAHLRRKYRDARGVWVTRSRFNLLKREGYDLPPIVIRCR